MVGAGTPDPIDMLIGNMALQQKLVDEGQLAEARMTQSMNPGRTLAAVLYQLEYISIQQAEKLEHAATVLRVREEDKILCELAVKRKMITQAQADEVLTVQKNAARNPGAIPRAKELLLNRNYVPTAMLDILMELVKQVSPYAPAPPPPPPKPPASVPEKKEGDTKRMAAPPPHVGPAGAKQGEAGKDAPAKPSVAPHVGPAGARQAEPGKESPKTPMPAKSTDVPGQRPGGVATPSAPLIPAVSSTISSQPASQGTGERIAKGKIFTTALHAGHTPDCRPTVDPIHPSVTYDFPSMEALEEFLNGKPDYWYSRHGNPTVRAAEEKIAALEGAEDAVLASSGLGILTAALMTFLRPNDSIATTDQIYGGTWHLLNEVMTEFGIQTRKVPAKDWLLIRDHLAGTTKMIYFEPITNPMCRIWDPRPAVKDAKRFGIITMLDNTFATPFNLRPIELGVDLVLHSATKYLGGHSDLMAGVVCGRKELTNRIRERLKYMGSTLSAFDAWLLLRGLKTFPLRMRAHNENAMHIARALETLSPKIKKVWYPGLDSHPDRQVAREILSGFGGIVSFELDGGLAGAKTFANRLKLCHRAVSLGGVETLVSLPVLSSHWQIPARELEKAGVLPGCVRLSVGIEDPDDILGDISQALA